MKMFCLGCDGTLPSDHVMRILDALCITYFYVIAAEVRHETPAAESKASAAPATVTGDVAAAPTSSAQAASMSDADTCNLSTDSTGDFVRISPARKAQQPLDAPDDATGATLDEFPPMPDDFGEFDEDDDARVDQFVMDRIAKYQQKFGSLQPAAPAATSGPTSDSAAQIAPASVQPVTSTQTASTCEDAPPLCCVF